LAGVLKNDRPGIASGAAAFHTDAQSMDAVARTVDLFVMRAVETLCLAEAMVPEAHRSANMQMRLDEAKRCIACLEDLLVKVRNNTQGPED
jgi:hypothetical protein